MTGDWRAALAAARRPICNPLTVEWDNSWCRWYEVFVVDRGGSPVKAVAFADRLTTDQLDERPCPVDGDTA